MKFTVQPNPGISFSPPKLDQPHLLRLGCKVPEPLTSRLLIGLVISLDQNDGYFASRWIRDALEAKFFEMLDEWKEELRDGSERWRWWLRRS